MRDDTTGHTAERYMAVAAFAMLTLLSCQAQGKPMNEEQLREFGTRCSRAAE